MVRIICWTKKRETFSFCYIKTKLSANIFEYSKGQIEWQKTRCVECIKKNTEKLNNSRVFSALLSLPRTEWYDDWNEENIANSFPCDIHAGTSKLNIHFEFHLCWEYQFALVFTLPFHRSNVINFLSQSYWYLWVVHPFRYIFMSMFFCVWRNASIEI